MAAGEPLGALTLVRSDPLRRFTEDDRQLAEELGRRAGSAVLSARHTRSGRRSPRAPGRAAPPSLPAIAGLELATLSPRGRAHEVGGDFFDAFPTPGGWMIVIGDVAGQGPRAAALTGLARFTLRTAGQLSGDPALAAAQLTGRCATSRTSASARRVHAHRARRRRRAGRHRRIARHPLPVLLRAGAATSWAARPARRRLQRRRVAGAAGAARDGRRAGALTDGVFDTVGRAAARRRAPAGPAGAAATDAADVVAGVDRCAADSRSARNPTTRAGGRDGARPASLRPGGLRVSPAQPAWLMPSVTAGRTRGPRRSRACARTHISARRPARGRREQ